jgi:hypothetical protein
LIEVIFQQIEMCAPEIAIGGQPLIEIRERLRSDPVQAALPVDARLHQSRLPEDPQMLGHRRLAEAQPAHEFPDRLLPAAKQIEDGQPAGFG